MTGFFSWSLQFGNIDNSQPVSNSKISPLFHTRTSSSLAWDKLREHSVHFMFNIGSFSIVNPTMNLDDRALCRQLRAIRYLPSLQIQFRCTVQDAEDVNKVFLDCRLGPTLSCLVAKKAISTNQLLFCHNKKVIDSPFPSSTNPTSTSSSSPLTTYATSTSPLYIPHIHLISMTSPPSCCCRKK